MQFFFFHSLVALRRSHFQCGKCEGRRSQSSEARTPSLALPPRWARKEFFVVVCGAVLTFVCMLRYSEWNAVPIWFLDSSVFIVERCTDTATLRQFQDRTPRVRFRPFSGFIFFPTGWKCQPEGEDIGSGCCGGGVIQLRLRERALLRQGQLFEPTASSGPAAMLLAISRNLSCIPRRSPCPGRYPLPLASLFLSTLTDPSCIPRSPCPDRYPLPPGIPLQKKNATQQAASS